MLSHPKFHEIWVKNPGDMVQRSVTDGQTDIECLTSCLPQLQITLLYSSVPSNRTSLLIYVEGNISSVSCLLQYIQHETGVLLLVWGQVFSYWDMFYYSRHRSTESLRLNWIRTHEVSPTCTIHSLFAFAMISRSSQKNAESDRLICKKEIDRWNQAIQYKQGRKLKQHFEGFTSILNQSHHHDTRGY